MSIITKRITHTSVAAQIIFSSFSSLGTSTSATFDNPVFVYIVNGTNRLYLGGSNAVSTGTGYLLSSAGTTSIRVRQGEDLWGITSAAVNSTASYLLTNQPT